MRKEDVLEKGELLGEQLDPLLQHLVLRLELGDPVVGLLGLLPGLLAGPLHRLVVAGAAVQVLVVLLVLAARAGRAAAGLLARTHSDTLVLKYCKDQEILTHYTVLSVTAL